VAVAERGTARIGYQDRFEGRRGDGDAPPVLLVHGGLHERTDAARFRVAPGVAGAVAGAGYRLLLPDRRWLGGATTAPVREHTWPLEGDDLAAVLRHAGAAPALVVAGSNGCSAALRLALDRPGLVAGLVLAWPPLREDPWLREAFGHSAALVAAAGTHAYLDLLRDQGVPGWGERRPGLAFGVALETDPLARDSFERLDTAAATARVCASGHALLAGETVRGARDQELRSLAASGIQVAVIAPASDGPTHTRAVAERLAGLTGAEPPGEGFPETPQRASPPPARPSRRPCWPCSPACASAAAAHQRRRGRTNLVSTKAQNSSGKSGKNPRGRGPPPNAHSRTASAIRAAITTGGVSSDRQFGPEGARRSAGGRGSSSGGRSASVRRRSSRVRARKAASIRSENSSQLSRPST
jgi:pimeloyl-ACP methyl ester carboxylesterase